LYPFFHSPVNINHHQSITDFKPSGWLGGVIASLLLIWLIEEARKAKEKKGFVKRCEKKGTKR